MPKKLKGLTLWNFSTPILSQNIKELKTFGTFEELFSKKKSNNAEKTERGDSLVSPGMVCYAQKKEKPFWFSSLGQIIQFGTIKVCRTILVSWCGLKKKELKSHCNSRLSLHYAPTNKT